MKKVILSLSLFIISSGIFAWSNQKDKFSIQPYDASQGDLDLPAFMRLSPQWAQQQLDSLSLEDKIAQSFMVGVRPENGENHIQLIDSLIDTYHIGGVIMFRSNVEQTKELIHRFQDSSKLPLLVSMDAEWGSNMRLSDGEQFPYQLTLGAANQIEGTKLIAQAMGAELNNLGINLSFSPVVDVNTNPNNPIIGFRSFGENPVNVAKHSVAMIQGLQSFNVLACMKHFPGHGDTDVDSHKNLPTVNKSYEELNRMDWLPYKQGRLVGASAVMIAHLNVPALDSSGLPSSLSPIIIKDYLRGKLGFSGLVISDALNMGALTKHYGDVDIVKRAYLAGNDILLCPSRDKIRESIDAISKAVKDGEITEEEVNEKTMRILRAKYYAAEYKNLKKPSLSEEQIDYAKINVYEKALIVVKNDSAIPVQDVSGKNLILNIGGDGTSFNLSSALYTNADTVNLKNANDAWAIYKFSLQKYDHVYINLIASSIWPAKDYHYPAGWREFLKELPSEPKIYVTLFGNPYVVKESEIFEKADAVILAFQDSEIGQNRAAQLLFGGFQGKSVLPMTLNADYQEGFGIITPKASRLKFTVPMELGVSDTVFNRIDSIAMDGIRQGAYPSCQIVVAKDGKVVYRKAFGYFTYYEREPVNNRTLYDIASITKIAASTYGLMYLEDRHQFSLDSTLGYYLGDLTKGTPYHDLNMRDILTHQARLIPWVPFYTKTLVNGFPDTTIYSTLPTGNRTAMVASHLYIDKDYEDTIFKIIVGKPLRKQSGYKYSDLAFYFAKRIIEKVSGEQLEDLVMNNLYAPSGLTTMGYNPWKRFDLSRIAPTEIDDYFRHRLIQGHVHDMGAAMMGGVGGHAGVFSDATDLAGYMQMLLNGGTYGGKRYLSREVINEYTACQFCPQNRRGDGFDKPVIEGGGGPASSLVSKSSFGHTGFTGTIAWADPENQTNYVFLSNRVYPSGENWKIVKMDIRTKIQTVIYEVFKK